MASMEDVDMLVLNEGIGDIEKAEEPILPYNALQALPLYNGLPMTQTRDNNKPKSLVAKVGLHV